MTFAERVYSELRLVPRGKVTTYKVLAEKLGSKAYRAVGTAMKNNPYAPDVPCHRVVRSDGRIGGFMGKSSGVEIEKKIALLNSEGVKVADGKIVNFKNVAVLTYKEMNLHGQTPHTLRIVRGFRIVFHENPSFTCRGVSCFS